jgi:sortase (surface protein transpeptidase)
VSAAGNALRVRRRRRISRAAPLVAVPVALLLAFVGTNVSASLAQRGLERAWAQRLASARGLAGADLARAAPAIGDPVARLVIPAIGLDAIVVEGASAAEMRRGPGHLPSTPFPGDAGVSTITANRFGFGGFFAEIGRLAPGDRVTAETAGGLRTFVVTTVTEMPAEGLDLDGDGTSPALMLFASARRWGGGDRIVVRAVAEDV